MGNHLRTDRTLPPLNRSQNEAKEAEEVAQSWEELQQALPTLNEGQKAVFDQVVGAVEDGLSSETVEPREAPHDRFAPENFDDDEQDFSRPRCFLLNAAGGTGKTYLIKAIQNCMKVRRRKHFAVATSAVAAKLLKKGTTAHSAFRIPVPCGPGDTCYISVDSELADLIREAAIIIWDEIVMCHRHCIECVDRTLRDITEVEMPFGGKIVLFAGDFRQILPVVRGGSRAQIVNACMKSSPLYRNIKSVELTENMRLEALRQDPQASREALEFPNFLLKEGDGKVEMDAHGNIQLPPYIRKIFETANLCEHIYAEIEQKYNDKEWLKNRTILTTKNRTLKLINDSVGSKFPGELRTYLSADKVESDETGEDGPQYPVELLNSLTAGSALPDHELCLKKGYPVMLLRNIDKGRGHVNGARYIVKDMKTNVVFLESLTGDNAGQMLALPKMPCGPGDSSFPIQGFTRTQFPIRVCFCITLNKAQGQSFSGSVGLDLIDPVFTHGQLYVGLSRVTHPENLLICLPEKDQVITPNVVYPEVLQ